MVLVKIFQMRTNLLNLFVLSTYEGNINEDKTITLVIIPMLDDGQEKIRKSKQKI